jgi:hypothetical protein
MKRIKIILIVSLSLMLMSSECGRPDMLVINKVNSDGSVDRRLVMTYDEDDFDLDKMQVPVDSTWTLNKSLEVSEKGDSLWTLIAEKNFSTVEELNKSYDKDHGSNRHLNRWADFNRKFRWFNTVYYYSENVEKILEAYPPEDFLDNEYLHLFYMPEKIFNDYRYGQDSTMYKALYDTLEDKKDEWLGRCLVRGAIIELDSLMKESGDKSIEPEFISRKETELVSMLEDDFDLDMAIDSLFGKGYYEEHQVLIDSSVSKLEDKLELAMDVKTYLIQVNMPGELVETNGYIDTEGGIIWEVNSDVVFTKDYSMWAKSTVSNLWAWIVSGLFIVFVLLVVLLKRR